MQDEEKDNKALNAADKGAEAPGKEPETYNFYAFMDRMKYIKRWALMRSVREENIMEHSQMVVMLAHCLAVINNEIFKGCADASKTALYAVYHECSEVMTGDLPTPIKYFNKSMRGAYADLEDRASDKLLGTLPKELQDEFAKYMKPDKDSYEYKLMKAADRLSAYIKCVEEGRCGNDEFVKAEKSIKEDLDSRHMPEVEYFFKHFMPGFSLPLDDLEGLE
ncbi:MAG: 5'-deoxynucleotidase [Clostridia bacterium]|nr:5'-deoxynucleotidase [Clostridia bacterium]